MTDETALFNSHALFAVLSMHEEELLKLIQSMLRLKDHKQKQATKALYNHCMHALYSTDSYYFLNHTAMCMHRSLLKYHVATLALLDCTLLYSTMYLFGSTLLHSFMCLFGSTLNTFFLLSHSLLQEFDLFSLNY